MIDLQVKIVPRVNLVGFAFTEVLYTWTEDERQCHALTRYWYPLPPGPHTEAAERQKFIERRKA